MACTLVSNTHGKLLSNLHAISGFPMIQLTVLINDQFSFLSLSLNNLADKYFCII